MTTATEPGTMVTAQGRKVAAILCSFRAVERVRKKPMPLEFTEPQAEIHSTPCVALSQRESDQTQTAESNAIDVEPNLTDHSVESAQLSAELNTAVRRHQRIVTASMIAIFLSVLGSVLFFGNVDSLTGIYQHPQVALFLACFAFLLPMLAIVGTACYMVRGRTTAMRRKVQRLRANRSAGAPAALIDVMNRDDKKVRHSAALGLLDILPRWTEEDMAALGYRQRSVLYAALLDQRGIQVTSDTEPFTTHAQLCVALCQTFGRIGDHSELAVLRQLAASPEHTTNTVRLAAREAAVLLEARLAGQPQPRTLLRASDAPSVSSNQLLRAAASTPASPPDELLRPGDLGG